MGDETPERLPEAVQNQPLDYTRSRWVSSGAVLALVATLFLAEWLCSWMNTIPNTIAAALQYEFAFRASWLTGGFLLLGLVLLGGQSKLRAVRLASKVSLGVLVVAMVATAALSSVPFGIYWTLNSYMFVLPAAFFAAAVVRSCADAWRKVEDPSAVIWGVVISAACFFLCILVGLFIDKGMALGFCRSID